MKGLAGYVGLYTAYVVFLHAVDGPWKRWRRYGVIDAWTATHVAWGALARAMGVPEGTLVLLAASNELVELGTRRWRPDLVWGAPETNANIAMDVVSTWIGWRIASSVSVSVPHLASRQTGSSG